MKRQGKRIVGFIPARGGSKGVRRKNVRDLCGMPLIAHTIIEARKATEIDRVIVSTEDEEIATIARDYGAETPFTRPAELAEDHVPDSQVVAHALQCMIEIEGSEPAVVVLLRATSPLKTAQHIGEAVALLLENDRADSVRSVTIAAQHPLRCWGIAGGLLVSFVPEFVFGLHKAYNMPRQILPPAYVQNGAIDVFWSRNVLESGPYLGATILPYIMDAEDSVNIDTELDFILAEILMKKRMASHLKVRD